jgi:NAD(P)H dehydrogenase (quinone)
MGANVAVIYYSMFENGHRIARAVAEGAEQVGAAVRVRQAREVAAPEVIASVPRWAASVDEWKHVPEAELADIEWAHAMVFGSPSHYGNMAAQLKLFVDSTARMWSQGGLNGKVASGFVTASTTHGGLETTIVSMHNTFCHWGCVIVPVGYTDPAVFAAGGNPYGTSHDTSWGQVTVPETVLDAARYQGRRVATIAEKLIDLDPTSYQPITAKPT